MRVVLITYVYPHPTAGFNPGIERVVGEIAPALAALGHDVHVLTSFRNGEAPPNETHRGVTIHRVPDLRLRLGRPASVASLDFISLAEQMIRGFAELIGSAHVAHTFTPLHRWPFRTPLFAHFHHLDRPRRLQEFLFMPTASRLWRRTYAMSRAVVSVSKYSEAEFHQAYPDVRTPTNVVHNGVDLERFQFRPRNSVNLPPSLLYVGPLLERKGLRYLISAVPAIRRAHPAVRLRIVGNGPEERALKALAEEVGVADCVEFLGFVSDRTLTDIYASSTVFTFPSLHEGFGIVLAEAMAAGLAIVAADSTAIPEVVGDCGLLVPPRDSKALAEAVVRLLNDPQSIGQYVEMGFKRVRSRFTWSVAAERLTDLYGH